MGPGLLVQVLVPLLLVVLLLVVLLPEVLLVVCRIPFRVVTSTHKVGEVENDMTKLEKIKFPTLYANFTYEGTF
jgi:hypothetical protein